eukprot:scaffold8680_cov48-Attheya_sp.AAC.1
MAELRQRRPTGESSQGVPQSSKSKKKTTAKVTFAKTTSKAMKRVPAQQPTRASVIKTFAAIFFLYVPLVAFINPHTIQRWYGARGLSCEGTCDVSNNESNADCGPVNANRIVFLRIPKTASSTLKRILLRPTEHWVSGEKKGTVGVDVGELEDLVSSIPRPGAPIHSQGYSDPDPHMIKQRQLAFYTHVENAVWNPPTSGQNRTIFEGHVHHYNWTQRPITARQRKQQSPLLSNPIVRQVMPFVPQFLLALYGLDKATRFKEKRKLLIPVREITMLRSPQDRLASMYYFDRHDARTIWWREELVQQLGNATFEECLLNSKCVEVNQLRQSCSLQVETLCGIDPQACARPMTKAALDRAKQNMKDYAQVGGIMYVGIMERMQESLQFLERLLPTYLEGMANLDLTLLPRHRQGSSPRREKSFSPQAQKVLDDICYWDNQLYEFADRLLTQRLNKCGV